MDIVRLLYANHGRGTLRYCETKDELARFLSAADKTPLQRLSYMSCRPPLTLAGFGVFDGAKLHKIFELATTNFSSQEPASSQAADIQKVPVFLAGTNSIYQMNNLIQTIQRIGDDADV